MLNLAGLYGGERNPKNWITRVAKSKDQVKGKKALHLIHGEDVGRAIIAVHKHFTPHKRWLLTDLRVYDWWDLIQSWGANISDPVVQKTEGYETANELRFVEWVGELMFEEDVRSLPRSADGLGRVLDSRGFWKKLGLWPTKGSVLSTAQ